MAAKRVESKVVEPATKAPPKRKAAAKCKPKPKPSPLPAPAADLAVTQMSTMDTFIAKAVESGTGADQLNALLDAKIRFEGEEARKEYTKAMCQFQSDCPEIDRDARVDYKDVHYAYASLDQLTKHVRPYTKANKLSWIFDLDQEKPGICGAGCIIMHASGYQAKAVWAYFPHDASGKKDPLKAARSAMKYAQRASLEMALGLATQDPADDDGDAAAEGPDTINDIQVDHLQTLYASPGVKITGMTVEKLLAYAESITKKPVADLSQLPKSVYDVAVQTLEAKAQWQGETP